MKTFCYIRVSTEKQDYSRQEFILKEKGYIDGVNCTYVEETGTGKSMNKREQLNNLLENVLQEGDTLVATDLTRISRSLIDFRNTMDLLLKKKKVNLILLKENFYLYADERMDAMTKGMINFVGVFAELERDVISDRVTEKMKEVKMNGSKSGKPIGKPRTKKNTQEKFMETLKEIINGNSFRKACDKTFYPLSTFIYNVGKYKKELNTTEYSDIYNAMENGDLKYE